VSRHHLVLSRDVFGLSGYRKLSLSHLIKPQRLDTKATISPLLVQPLQTFQSTEKVPDRVGVCGDGKVQAQHAEECDDGNQGVTDACLGELHVHTECKGRLQVVLIPLYV